MVALSGTIGTIFNTYFGPIGGTLTAGTTSTTDTLPFAVLELGNVSTNNGWYWSFQEARLWNVVLTPTQLNQEIVSATPVNTTGLQNRWLASTSTSLSQLYVDTQGGANLVVMDAGATPTFASTGPVW
jgi:hypothetical protein